MPYGSLPSRTLDHGAFAAVHAHFLTDVRYLESLSFKPPDMSTNLCSSFNETTSATPDTYFAASTAITTSAVPDANSAPAGATHQARPRQTPSLSVVTPLTVTAETAPPVQAPSHTVAPPDSAVDTTLTGAAVPEPTQAATTAPSSAAMPAVAQIMARAPNMASVFNSADLFATFSQWHAMQGVTPQTTNDSATTPVGSGPGTPVPTVALTADTRLLVAPAPQTSSVTAPLATCAKPPPVHSPDEAIFRTTDR